MLNLLLLTGIILAAGYLVGKATHGLRVTGVVGYILIGIILGPFLGVGEKLGISKAAFSEFWGLTTNFTLALIAFIIGSHFTARLLRGLGKSIVAMLLAESMGAFLVVALGVYLYTHDLVTTLLISSVAAATDPAASVAVLHEYRARGPLSTALLMLVGWDDAVASVIVVVALAAMKVLLGGEISISSAIAVPALEIVGGLALGAVIGGVLAFIVKRSRERETILVTTFASIFVGAGLAQLLDLSLILTCMATGIVFINACPAKGNASRGMVEGIMPMIYVLFFALAGMQLRFDLLRAAGVLVLIYIICRMVGKVSGISLSAKASKAPAVLQKYLGFGMFPQGGLAVGLMALLGAEIASFPGGAELAALGITTIMATTIIFEIIGPIGVRFAIFKAGEAKRR